MMEEMAKRLREFEEKSSQTEEDLKLKLQQCQKDMALKEQQAEFVEIQLNETREQLEEANRQHQSMVEAMKRQAEEEN